MVNTDLILKRVVVVILTQFDIPSVATITTSISNDIALEPHAIFASGCNERAGPTAVHADN
jgi:hypothetical protein